MNQLRKKKKTLTTEPDNIRQALLEMVNLWVWSYELKSRMDEGRKTDRPRCPRIFQILTGATGHSACPVVGMETSKGSRLAEITSEIWRMPTVGCLLPSQHARFSSDLALAMACSTLPTDTHVGPWHSSLCLCASRSPVYYVPGRDVNSFLCLGSC